MGTSSHSDTSGHGWFRPGGGEDEIAALGVPLRSSSGDPVSTAGPPQPGTGQVFVTFTGNLAETVAIWQCGDRFVFQSGEYGDLLRWGLSQPAERFFVPHPGQNGEPVEVFPGRRDSAR